MLLPADKARHVGEAVAMVVAETKAQAMDAAEAVEVRYEELPFVLHSEDAMQPGAPVLWDEVPNNVTVETVFGDVEATDQAFARAAHVVTKNFHIGRVTGVPLEPRAALGHYDAATGRYTLYAGSGGAVRQKNELIQVLGIAPENLRVLSPDVGGNFGTRNRTFVEFGLVLWAAKKLGRPVKFTATRSEAFLSDYQGRDLVTKVELALDDKHRFIAMRADQYQQCRRALRVAVAAEQGLGPHSRLLCDSGDDACAPWRCSPTPCRPMPIAAPAGRKSRSPSSGWSTLPPRSLASIASQLRRKNLVPPKAMPYRNSVGMLYDSGRYAENMDWAMEIADWKGFAARRREAKRRGKLLGPRSRQLRGVVDRRAARAGAHQGAAARADQPVSMW